MSDTTHEAPERIWITGDASKGSWNSLKANFEGPTETEYVRADRIEELESKLAKAVKALVKMVGKKYYADDPWEIASATLAELKGEKL